MTRKATAHSHSHKKVTGALCSFHCRFNSQLYNLQTRMPARTTTAQVTQIEGKRQTGRRDGEGGGPNLCVTPTPQKNTKKERKKERKTNPTKNTQTITYLPQTLRSCLCIRHNSHDGRNRTSTATCKSMVHSNACTAVLLSLSRHT